MRGPVRQVGRRQGAYVAPQIVAAPPPAPTPTPSPSANVNSLADLNQAWTNTGNGGATLILAPIDYGSWTPPVQRTFTGTGMILQSATGVAVSSAYGTCARFSGTGTGKAVNMSGCGGFTFLNLEIGHDEIGMPLTGGLTIMADLSSCTNFTVSQCLLHGAGTGGAQRNRGLQTFDGLYYSLSSNILIERNKFTRLQVQSLAVAPQNLIIQDNLFYDNQDDSIRIDTSTLQAAGRQASDILIQRNIGYYWQPAADDHPDFLQNTVGASDPAIMRMQIINNCIGGPEGGLVQGGFCTPSNTNNGDLTFSSNIIMNTMNNGAFIQGFMLGTNNFNDNEAYTLQAADGGTTTPIFRFVDTVASLKRNNGQIYDNARNTLSLGSGPDANINTTGSAVISAVAMQAKRAAFRAALGANIPT